MKIDWIKNNKQKVDESGFALVIVMVTLLMITILGLNAIMTSSTDIQIAGNERVSTKALFIADAGLNHGIRALRGQNFDTLLTAITGAYNADVATTKFDLINQPSFDGGNYKVYLINDYPNDPGDLGKNMYNSDTNDIVVLRSEATYAGITKVIEAKATRIAADFPIVGGVGIVGAVEEIDISGNAFSITGNDTDPTGWNTSSTTSCDATSGIAVSDTTARDAVIASLADENPDPTGNISDGGGSGTGAIDTISTNPDFDAAVIQAKVEDLMQYADRTITVDDQNITYNGGEANWGTFENPQVTVVNFTNTTGERELRIEGNSTGYGILIVNAANSVDGGELDIRGNFSWYGIIIFTGFSEAEIGHSGNINIYGGMLMANAGGDDTDNEVEIKGNTDIFYSCDAVTRAENYSSVSLGSWHELKS